MSSTGSSFLKTCIRKLLQVSTRVYLAKIEVRGHKNLPLTPAIFAGNHPSGLIDPMVVMTAMPHLNFSSVAKYSLFKAPVVSFFLKVMEAVPVAQPFDIGLKVQPTEEESKRINKEMFDITISRLLNGSNIIIFPEGTCHNTPTLKELKIGTARMALQIACNNGPRIPIVPLGLSYSTPSGLQFRGKVLVDIGRPIEITDELLKSFEEGNKEMKFAACHKLTDQIERQLRDVTIRVPDWTTLLSGLCARNNWAPPEYKNALLPNSKLDGKGGGAVDRSERLVEQCTAVVNGTMHASRPHIETDREIGVRKRKPPDGEVKFDSTLQQEAAKVAYFQLSGASNTNLSGIVDREFVEHMHLARRIYKPTGAKLSLVQYASLTRNFMRMALQRVGDPEFQKLWNELVAYREGLTTLGITDKYVAMHEIGTDPLGERLKALRQRAATDILKLAVFSPLSLVGTVSHAPVAFTAFHLGHKMGYEADTGDTSVVATMRMLVGFVGVLVTYPIFGVGTALALDTPLAAIPAMAALGLSGYAALEYPVSDVVKSFRGSVKLLSEKDNVDKLRVARKRLQQDIRDYVDMHADAKLKGWWKDPSHFNQLIKETQDKFEHELRDQRRRVTAKGIEEAGLTCYTIPLHNDFKRNPMERAVLTVKRAPGNKKALLWIPGRNDSFFHVHILDRILEAGFDLYALDLRRCGRAKVDANGEPVVPELLAHDSHNFLEYFEEIDATIAFLKNPSPRRSGDASALTILPGDGCDKVYSNIVLYSHSTGSLVSALYGNPNSGGAWRGAIDGYIFNSPFWAWNLKWYEGFVVENSHAVSPDVLIEKGGGVSDYSSDMRKVYGFPKLLKSTSILSASAGWCKEVTRVQTMLKRGELTLEKPALVLTTKADEVLRQEDIDKLTDHLTKSRSDGKFNANTALLVERVIDSSLTERSAHDVLAAPSTMRVNEAMTNIESWLHANFSDRD